MKPQSDDTPKVNNLTVKFLIEKINPVYLEAYDTLAACQYPINDFRAPGLAVEPAPITCAIEGRETGTGTQTDAREANRYDL